MSRGTLDTAAANQFSRTGLSPPVAGLSRTVPLTSLLTSAVRTPECTHSGLGSSRFARRYSGNRCFFLFLRLLRCFSSAGSLRMTMDSSYGAYGSHMRVSPFGNPWIVRYVPFPMAYRSLSRPSSAPSAKASAVCPSSLDHPHSVASGHGSSLSYALCVSIIEGVFCRIFTCSACRSFSFNFSVDVLGCLMLSHDKIVMDI